MTLYVDDKGTIFINQGDTGELILDGISTDDNYKIYFAIKDEDRNTIGSELVVNSEYQPSVTFYFTSEYTNLLSVPKDEYFCVYHYGIKSCTTDGNEDTLQVANSCYGKLNDIIVYPKLVEGLS